MKIAYITDEEGEESGRLANKVIQMFGQYFVAMDYHPLEKRHLVFDTYREQTGEKNPSSREQDRFEIVTASKDNRLYVMYSPDSQSFVSVFRDRYREEEHVFEDYVDVTIYDSGVDMPSPIPKEFQMKPILGM